MTLARQAGFSFQLALADVASITTTPTLVDTILKANAGYASVVGPYSQDGLRANDVGVACSLQVLAASVDDIWFTENPALAPGAAAGNEIIKGSGIYYFTNARIIRLCAKTATTIVRIHYYLSESG